MYLFVDMLVTWTPDIFHGTAPSVKDIGVKRTDDLSGLLRLTVAVWRAHQNSCGCWVGHNDIYRGSLLDEQTARSMMPEPSVTSAVPVNTDNPPEGAKASAQRSDMLLSPSRVARRFPRRSHASLEAGRLTFRHRASCILGQAFHYSPENAFYIFNQLIYFII